MIDFIALAAPFDPAQVSWRLGRLNAEKTKGQALAYLDARDVMDRLDAVCGPPNWQCDYPHANTKTVCRIGILTESGWVWKADGAGDSDIEAEKGALSDAFKRSAVRWGIGRYLYDLPSPWVGVELKGRTSFIAEHEKSKLRNLLTNHKSAPAKILLGPPQLHTNGMPLKQNTSQETAGKMLTKLWTIQGDAVSEWLKHDAVKRALDELDEDDRHRVEDLAEERNALGNLEAAQ
jgi:hypothetical protein